MDERGLMAVFAVSGSLVVLAMHAHERFLSSFIKKMEFEIKGSTGAVKDKPKKKVRFAVDDMEKFTVKKAYRKNGPSIPPPGDSRNGVGHAPKLASFVQRDFTK